MLKRFTDRARKVMALANDEAKRLRHDCIGAEHTLLGLVTEGSGVGAHVLKRLGADPRRVREAVEERLKPGECSEIGETRPQTPRARRVIEYAGGQARFLRHHYVGSEHLLLGLLEDGGGVAGEVLLEFGLTVEKARREIINLFNETAEESPLSGLPEELTPIIPERFKTHPLVLNYQAIITALSAEIRKSRAKADLLRVEELRAHAEILKFELDDLLEWLEADPDFGLAPDK
jgi:ATP-dependent Clp protease ATP-binding subunit ClpA